MYLLFQTAMSRKGEALPTIKQNDYNIQVPIPLGVLNAIEENFTEKDSINAKGFTHEICKRYFQSHKYIPFSGYVGIHSTDVRRFTGGAKKRKLWERYREILLDETSYSTDLKKSKSYRFKRKYLIEGYQLFNVKTTIESSHKNKEEGALCALCSAKRNLNSLKGSCLICRQASNFLENLDWSNCNLGNEDLLNDIAAAASKKIRDSISVKERGNNYTITFRLKHKLRTNTCGTISIPKPCKDSYLRMEEKLWNAQRQNRISKIKPHTTCHRDKTVLRLHSIVTNIPSEAIKYITYINEALVEIDMHNCHYTLFSNILYSGKGDFFEKLLLAYPQLRDINKSLKAVFQQVNVPTLKKGACPPPITLAGTNYHIDESVEYYDLIRFIVWSLNGTLYEEIGKLFKKNGDIYTHSQVKGLLMSVFYGKRNAKTREVESFRKLFPNLLLIADSFKKYIEDNWDEIKTSEEDIFQGLIRKSVEMDRNAFQSGKASLSTILQGEESGLFVDKLLPIVYLDSIPGITKHDSLLVPKSSLAMAKEVMVKVLDWKLGINQYKLRIHESK